MPQLPKSRRKRNNYFRKTPNEFQFFVFDNRVALGIVEFRADKFIAYCASGRLVVKFSTLTGAIKALPLPLPRVLRAP